ncbi:hypothetical protein D3C73_1570710 [compost metagenome]
MPMNLLEHAVSLYASIAFVVHLQCPQSVRVSQTESYGRGCHPAIEGQLNGIFGTGQFGLLFFCLQIIGHYQGGR